MKKVNGPYEFRCIEGRINKHDEYYYYYESPYYKEIVSICMHKVWHFFPECRDKGAVSVDIRSHPFRGSVRVILDVFCCRAVVRGQHVKVTGSFAYWIEYLLIEDPRTQNQVTFYVRIT